MLKDGQRKVELIEYDDRTQPPEAIKAVERLAAVDKVDWIAGLYGTGFNVAAIPTFAKLGYPQIPVACVTELGPQLVKNIRCSSSAMARSPTTHDHDRHPQEVPAQRPDRQQGRHGQYR